MVGWGKASPPSTESSACAGFFPGNTVLAAEQQKIRTAENQHKNLRIRQPLLCIRSFHLGIMQRNEPENIIAESSVVVNKNCLQTAICVIIY